MKLLLKSCASLILLAGFSGAVFAQAAQDVRITVSHPGIDHLKVDLSTILELTEPTEQDQQQNIDGYIDSFVMGLDTKQPFQISVPLGSSPTSVLLSVSLKNFKDFRENLASLGYEFERDADDKALYKLNSDPDYGWMREIAGSPQLLLLLTSAIAAEESAEQGVDVVSYQKKLLADLRRVIAEASVLPIAPAGNMSAEILNADGSAEAQTLRKSKFATLRSSTMDAIQKRPEESMTELALRERFASNLLDEAERVVVESSLVSAVLNLDVSTPAAMSGTLNTSLKAISGSSLAESITLFGTKLDAFVSVPMADGSAFSLRINHPIDTMRQTNIQEILTLTEKDMEARVKASTELSASEQDATLTLTRGVLAVISDSVRSGFTNAFVEAVPDGQGDFVSVSAFSAPSAEKLNELLPLLATAGKGNVVDVAADKEGAVTIHRVQLAAGYSDFMDTAFGEKKDIFIGVGPGMVWLASGPGSKDRLKATIAALGEPAANSSPLHIELKLLPWVQKADRLAKLKPEGTTAAEKEAQREQARKRARAIAAFADADGVTVDFQIRDGEVLGELKFGTGILRLVGKEMAAFSKANLE